MRKSLVAAVVALAGTSLVVAGCSLDRSSGEPAAQEPTGWVWAVGDGADGSARAKELARRIAVASPSGFLFLGDVYERGTYAEFLSKYATVYGPLASKTAPTPGNHDWPNHLRGYDRYWARAHGRPQRPYYAFSIGGWRILSLNSEEPHGPGSPQLRWLRGQLGPGTCRLAFWHRPRFSAGTVHGDQLDMDPVWRALRGHAALALAGHEHDSQRFKPRDGIVELVAGAGHGSGGLYPLRRDARLAFGNARELAALRLKLTPGRARFAFVTADGGVLNSGTVPCRP